MAVLDSQERIGQLDLVLLGQLAVSAVAWGLPLEDAVALVVHDCCVLWTTTGWTKAGWEAGLVEALGRGAVPVIVENVAVPVVDEVSVELDYGARVAQLDEVARAHGAGDPEVLERRLQLAEAVREAGIRQKDVEGLRHLLGIVRGAGAEGEERLRVLADMDAGSVGAAEVRRAISVVAGGRALGLDGADVVRVMQGIEDAGLEPAAVGAWAVQVMADLGAIDQQVAFAQAELRRWTERVLERATDLATANARIEKLSEIIQRAKAEPALGAAYRLAESEREREVVAQIFREAAEIARAQTVSQIGSGSRSQVVALDSTCGRRSTSRT